MSQLPLMVAMCFVAMIGAIVVRPRKLQFAALGLPSPMSGEIEKMMWIAVLGFIVLLGIAIVAPAYGIGPFSSRRPRL